MRYSATPGFGVPPRASLPHPTPAPWRFHDRNHPPSARFRPHSPSINPMRPDIPAEFVLEHRVTVHPRGILPLTRRSLPAPPLRPHSPQHRRPPRPFPSRNARCCSKGSTAYSTPFNRKVRYCILITSQVRIARIRNRRRLASQGESRAIVHARQLEGAWASKVPVFAE